MCTLSRVFQVAFKHHPIERWGRMQTTAVLTLHLRQAFAKEAESHSSNSLVTGFAMVDRLFVSEASVLPLAMTFIYSFQERQNNRTTKIPKQYTYLSKNRHFLSRMKVIAF